MKSLKAIPVYKANVAEFSVRSWPVWLQPKSKELSIPSSSSLTMVYPSKMLGLDAANSQKLIPLQAATPPQTFSVMVVASYLVTP
jgi:hypothetical protein